MFLVRASFRLADGRELGGFVTPAAPDDADDLGLIQPHMKVSGWYFGFWGGMFGVSTEHRDAVYSAVGGDPDTIFPIAFESAAGTTTTATSGRIAGFYRSPDLKEIVVER